MTEPFRPHSSAVEVVLKLGAAARILVDTDPEGYPILAIVTPEINLLIMPYGASEGGPLTKDDDGRGSDLVIAAVDYRNAIHAQLDSETAGLPKRRRSRTAAKDPQISPAS